MSNQVAERDIIPGFNSMQSFELAQRAAKLLAASSLVPKEFQNDVPNCVIALNMANRMGADPLMVMQNLYIVYGRPGWSSQFLIATFNTSGGFSALRYEWLGEEGKDNFGCRAWAVEKATGEKLIGSTVTIAIAKKEGWYSKSGSKWQSMPQQMLMYRAASWFIRAYAPEMAMGMHTEDEIYDTIDLAKADYEIKVDREVSENANKEVIDITEISTEVTGCQDLSDTEQKDPIQQGTIMGEDDTDAAGPGF
ncbi:MAG: hypothetical protein WC147_10145 [Syntrophomonas sp.]